MQCDREAIEDEIQDADVVVPLMSRLGAVLLQQASRAKLILQFGVGVEGVDIPAVRAPLERIMRIYSVG